jgi:cystathionine beta-lyase/cystathionine gamma-synthase
VSKARRGPLGRSTVALHGGGRELQPGDPVVPAIVQSATFRFGNPNDGDLLYTRYGNNPVQRHVGQKVAELEGMEAGLVLASGMAATTMTLLALAGRGDHIVASDQVYGATWHLLAEELPRRGIETTFVDPARPEGWRRALCKRTRLLFLETPTNPTLRVYDPRPVAVLADERGIPLVMDTTFASPVNLRAAEHGADVVIHSATKYLGGHSDLIAGVVVGSAAVVDEVTRMMRLYGPAVDPHACWLLDRGVRTLDVRVRRQNDSALALARWLAEQDAVETVLYPGLPSHPDHAVAFEILDGFGGMLAFVVRGGGRAADAFMDALTVAIPAPSLGGVETLVSQPRHTSHAGMRAAERKRLGIPDGFVRVSVGVEDVDDLIADFEAALRG